LARRHRVSEATFYDWKSKHGRLAASKARRLRALETNNAKLKGLLAEAMLDQDAPTRRAAKPAIFQQESSNV